MDVSSIRLVSPLQHTISSMAPSAARNSLGRLPLEEMELFLFTGRETEAQKGRSAGSLWNQPRAACSEGHLCRLTLADTALVQLL